MGPFDDRDLIPLRPAFDIVRRGYDRAQVDYRIEELTAYLHIATADSDAGAAQVAELTRQLAAVREELDESRREVQRLGAPPTTLEGLSERLKRMLRLAQNEAAEITAKAQAAAAQRMADAERDAGDLPGRYREMIKETERRRAEMETEHQRVLAEARRQAEQIVAQATGHAAELDAEAATRRRQVEEDFEITMSARRSEAMRRLADQEATSKSEAVRRIDEATEAARRVVSEADHSAVTMVEEATRRVEALRLVRHQVTEQLQAVRGKLEDTFAHLAVSPEEDLGLAVVTAQPVVSQRSHPRTTHRQQV